MKLEGRNRVKSGEHVASGWTWFTPSSTSWGTSGVGQRDSEDPHTPRPGGSSQATPSACPMCKSVCEYVGQSCPDIGVVGSSREPRDRHRYEGKAFATPQCHARCNGVLC